MSAEPAVAARVDIAAKLEAARAYIAAGCRVGLLHYPDPVTGRCSCGEDCGKNAAKHPLTRVMGGGLTRFTRDIATLERWLKQEPNANLGIEPPPGYAFFDVDDLAAMQADGRTWPATLQERTGRGGLHLAYRSRVVGILNSVKLLPYMDVRGPGSYIVTTPSVHILGVTYGPWEPAFDLAAVADAPEWLEELLAAKAAEVNKAKDTTAPTFTWQRDAEVPEKLEALLANDPRARLTWEGQRADLPSPSEYDLSLADTFARAGWSDQEIADALTARRREWGHELKRAAYYVTTIKKARASQGARPTTPDNDAAGQESAGKATQTDVLLQLVRDVALWTTPDAVAFATITSEDGHQEHWPVRSRTFRLALQQRFFNHGGRAPSSHAMTDALGTIEALARNSGEQHEVAVRLAEYGGKLYLDLGDPRWQAVEIDAAGWRVVANPPVRFRRSRGMLPLPVPVAGGSLDALKPFVPGGEDTFRLVLGWLVQAVRAAGPYMILVLVGEQGTGKSLLARLLRLVIDPNTVVLRSVPREERDLAITATNSYIIAIDNISGLPVWLSDGICRIASGAGFATRELYSDDEETLLSATRPVILNGIDDVASRGDILDRSILVTLPTIDDSERRDEREIVAAFNAAAPAILGALCTAVSTAVSRRDQVKLARLPRMADATLWIVAAEPALPWAVGGFLDAYVGNRAEAVAVALEADSVAGAVLRLMNNRTMWSGTAGDLLAALGKLVDDPKPRDWPVNPRALSARLRRAAPALRAVGWEVHSGKVKGTRGVSIERVQDSGAKPAQNGANGANGAKPAQNPHPENASGNGKRDANGANGAKIPPLFNFPNEEKRGEGEEKRVEVEICTE